MSTSIPFVRSLERRRQRRVLLFATCEPDLRVFPWTRSHRSIDSEAHEQVCSRNPDALAHCRPRVLHNGMGVCFCVACPEPC